MIGCGRIYRRLARAFPHEFRTICGDGLEQLGEDLMPLVWRDHGVAGIKGPFKTVAVFDRVEPDPYVPFG